MLLSKHVDMGHGSSSNTSGAKGDEAENQSWPISREHEQDAKFGLTAA